MTLPADPTPREFYAELRAGLTEALDRARSGVPPLPPWTSPALTADAVERWRVRHRYALHADAPRALADALLMFAHCARVAHAGPRGVGARRRLDALIRAQPGLIWTDPERRARSFWSSWAVAVDRLRAYPGD